MVKISQILIATITIKRPKIVKLNANIVYVIEKF